MGRLNQKEMCFLHAAKERMKEQSLPEDIRVRDMQIAFKIIDRLSKEKVSWDRKFRVAFNSGHVELRGLIDTGNKVKEPRSKLPVMLVSGNKIERYLTHEKMVEVGYGVVGGSGRMDCFMPDSLFVFSDGEWNRLQKIWIGIVKGRMPMYDAIAPIEVEYA